MSFVIQQSTTALHILPAPHGTGITTRRRQGEVLVSDGVHTKQCFFDKVTYAPFQEALYSAVGGAALVQRSLSQECHSTTWIAGKLTEEAMIDVCKVFATNTVKALFARPQGPIVSGRGQGCPIVECSARCIYPWGVLDLVRNEELPGEAGTADWSACGNKSLADTASFDAVLHAVLRFLREAAKGGKRQCPLLQIRFLVKPSPTADSSYTLTISPPVAEVCRVFAMNSDTLQEAFLRRRKGRWVDSPVFKYLVPPSVSLLDSFTLVTCTGGAEEGLTLRGKRADASTSLLAACSFGSKDAATALSPAKLVNDSIVMAMPSPVPTGEVDRSVVPANVSYNERRADDDSDAANDGVTTAMQLFGGRGEDMSKSSLTSANGSGAAPPLTEAAKQLPSAWQESPLTYFGHFREDRRTAVARVSPSQVQQIKSAFSAATLFTGDTVSEATEGFERELMARVREKERRAEAAVRLAEERMAQSRRTEQAARDLVRNSDAEIVKVRARYDSVLQRMRSEEEVLQRRRDEASAALEDVTARVFEASEEAVKAEVRVQASNQELQRSLKACQEARSRALHVEEEWRKSLVQAQRLTAAYVAYTQHTSLLFSSAVVYHQEAFDEAVASVDEIMVKHYLAHKQALEEVHQRLDASTTQLADAEEKRNMRIADMEDVERQTQDALNVTAGRVTHLRDTERSLHETIAALQAQLDTLRKQVEAAAAAAHSNRLEAEHAAARVMSQQCLLILSNKEALERQEISASWEGTLASELGKFTASLRDTAARELSVLLEEQQRAQITVEASTSHASSMEHFTAALPKSGRAGPLSPDLEAFHFPPGGALSPVTETPTSSERLAEEVAALQETKARLEAELEVAHGDIQGLCDVKEALEGEVAAILQELDLAVGEVVDSETAMLRESDRSLKILQLSAAESASQYSALLDRCTALIEMRSASRRNSVTSSNYGD